MTNELGGVVQAFPPSLRFGEARRSAKRGGGRPAVAGEPEGSHYIKSRREFLAGLAALGAGALLTNRDVSGQAANPRRIDVHQHFVSPKFLATLTAKNTVAPVAGFAAWRNFSPASTVENLDRIGVATAMLSITAPGVSFGDVQEACQLARDINEYATAKMVSDYKGRFGLFAVLPLSASSSPMPAERSSG